MFEEIRKNWMLIIFIGSLITSWTMFNARLTVVEVKAQETETALTKIIEMREDIAVMKNDIKYIKEIFNK